VFRKSWSGEKRLLQAAILIFVPGILKCLEKPFALKSASIHSIGDTSNKTWVERMIEDESKDNDGIKSLDDYVEAASTYVVQGDHAGETAETGVNDKPYNLFVDLAFPYSDRLKNLKYMMQKKKQSASSAAVPPLQHLQSPLHQARNDGQSFEHLWLDQKRLLG